MGQFRVLGSVVGTVVVSLLEGSWVVITGAISPLKGGIVIVILLIAPLIITHEPPSTQGCQEQEEELQFLLW